MESTRVPDFNYVTYLQDDLLTISSDLILLKIQRNISERVETLSLFENRLQNPTRSSLNYQVGPPDGEKLNITKSWQHRIRMDVE
jgi:hypothetical protein